MKPMLALEWGKRGMEFPLFLSPKIDGIRCIAHVEEEGVRLRTRSDKPIVSMDHIADQLEDLCLPVGTVLDGELYVHGAPFQQLSGVIRRRTINDESREVQYHVYDLARSPSGLHTRSYTERYDALIRMVFNPDVHAPNVLLTRCMKVNTPEEFETEAVMHLEQGYEGSMARPGGDSDFYQSEDYGHAKRSPFLLKVKLFDDAEFLIVGIEEEFNLAGEPKGRTGKLVMEGDGITFRASGLTDEMKEDTWNNREKYIGQWATIKYFGKSLGGVPRHPNFLRLWESE